MTDAPLRDPDDGRPRLAAVAPVASPPTTPPATAGADASAGAGARVLEAVTAVLLGHDRVVQLAVAAFLAGGHVLIEDSPGVGKTLLAKALSQAIGGTFGRVQATADLLPSDVTGVSVFDPDTRQWSFRPGPVFHNVVLVDEFNRCTPRAQSALLESMAENHVTVDSITHALPDPFFVIATQNPQNDHGTFPLVAGQRDRFAVCLQLGIPDSTVERALLRGKGGTAHLEAVVPVATVDEWHRAQRAVEQIAASDLLLDYLLALVQAIRAHPAGDPELSPRASMMLLRVAWANAALERRSFVLPDDIQFAAPAVVAHRLPGAGGSALTRVRAILETVAVPPATG